MKVISEDCTLSLLESLRFRSEHLVKMLQISVRASELCELDLKIAEANLEQVELLIDFIKETSFEASEIYNPREAVWAKH